MVRADGRRCARDEREKSALFPGERVASGASSAGRHSAFPAPRGLRGKPALRCDELSDRFRDFWERRSQRRTPWIPFLTFLLCTFREGFD
jgi:hypothetical protein